MKRINLILILFVLASLACNFGVVSPPQAGASTVTVPPVDEPPLAEPATEAVPATEAPTPIPGLARSCDKVQLVIPQGLAADIECQLMPAQSGEEIAPWEVTPGHVEIGFTGYTLGEKFHRPRLYVFPVIDLVALQPYVAENINEVRAILDNPAGLFDKADLPGIHFFNAGAVFAANIATVDFLNGAGVRALTVFGQYYAPVNNDELFYHFQGLSADGQYYLIAILPVTHPGLQADDQEGSLPASAEFPVYPGFSGADVEAEMGVYYDTTSALLNAASPDVFSPTLTTLDALIQSIQVAP